MNAEQKARELLESEYRSNGWEAAADDIRDVPLEELNRFQRVALRAITRALQQRPSEEEVEAAARRMANGAWDILEPHIQARYLIMARDALGGYAR